jgi:hypothetical protein
VQVHCIEIATGKETLAPPTNYAGIDEQTVAKLHPGGTAIYYSEPFSPSPISKMNISAGTVSLTYKESASVYKRCPHNVWIAADGTRVFDGCGNAYRCSANNADDLTSNDSLSGITGVQSLSHSAASGQVAVIPSADQDTEVDFYSYEFLAFQGTVMLPAFSAGNESHPSHGRFVFQSADGARQFVIVQAPEFLNDFGIVTIESPVAPVPAGSIILPSSAYRTGVNSAEYRTDVRILNQGRAR